MEDQIIEYLLGKLSFEEIIKKFLEKENSMKYPAIYEMIISMNFNNKNDIGNFKDLLFSILSKRGEYEIKRIQDILYTIASSNDNELFVSSCHKIRDEAFSLNKNHYSFLYGISYVMIGCQMFELGIRETYLSNTIYSKSSIIIKKMSNIILSLISKNKILIDNDYKVTLFDLSYEELGMLVNPDIETIENYLQYFHEAD